MIRFRNRRNSTRIRRIYRIAADLKTNIVPGLNLFDDKDYAGMMIICTMLDFKEVKPAGAV